MAGYDLMSCLRSIDPGECSYQEWVEVGMALHAEGYGVEVWDEWSAQDAPRYHQGECERKWAGFGGSASSVKGGTIVDMARRRGWAPTSEPDEVQGWGTITVEDVRPIDVGFIESRSVLPPEEWHPGRQLSRYVEALFKSGERVGITCGSYVDDDGKHKPVGGVTMERDYLLSELEKWGDELPKAVGEYDRDAGAWVCFNPLDGEGRGNKNVTAYRYALVESDSVPKDRQRGMIEALGLPVAALVDSGGKSVHAIVRVDAPDLEEYRKRVNLLYEYCAKKGFEVDTQNKNPSRLSRMPGAVRGEGKQWLVAVDAHPKPWREWVEEVAEEADGMPGSESLAEVFADMPPKAPELIRGVLRQGHKMLVVGPSKAGKSFALIELCAAVASGTSWFGKRCAQGPVLYVNLEIDRPSCIDRFAKVFDALGVSRNYAGYVEVWNLRGKSLTLDRLAPRIVRRASKMASPPIAIVIDPIYKVMTGDENSASDMGAFCNLFDYIARETGAAVIYCHHQSKGAQGFKTAMDRASGSGVFARDPDAMLDVSELVLDEDGEQMPEADGTPFEATWITREFRPPATQKVWFRYPVHVIDESGALDRAGVAGSAKAQSEAKKREKRRRRQDDMLVKSKVNSAVLRALAGEYAGVEVVKREDVIGYVADAIGDAMDDYNYDDFFNARNRFAAFRYVRIAGNEFGLVPCRNPQALFFDDTDLEVYQNMCTSGGTPI